MTGSTALLFPQLTTPINTSDNAPVQYAPSPPQHPLNGMHVTSKNSHHTNHHHANRPPLLHIPLMLHAQGTLQHSALTPFSALLARTGHTPQSPFRTRVALVCPPVYFQILNAHTGSTSPQSHILQLTLRPITHVFLKSF